MLFIETKLDDAKILLNVESIGYLEPHRNEKDKTIVYFNGQVGNVNFATLNESYDTNESKNQTSRSVWADPLA